MDSFKRSMPLLKKSNKLKSCNSRTKSYQMITTVNNCSNSRINTNKKSDNCNNYKNPKIRRKRNLR